ncbi:uncharacterized protein LOC125475590 [Pyrus x bretschneideri]|uniref:uncharacterized protein LOC125475590 n=1 Tax=Pyrus x bretschneideri TaxID=225117 RepID=UPI00202E1FFB|nr:uncharacterized protein LOC125475590 [Pyrus x bretschneideri]
MKEKSSSVSYTEWFLSKDQLQVGDTVRSRKLPNSCKPENMHIPEGKIVGAECDTDQHGFVLVRVHGIHDLLRVHVSTLERITFGLATGDWVRLQKEYKKHSPVGILHSITRDGNVAVGFIGLETLWTGNSSEFQMAESYCVGQFVRLKANFPGMLTFREDNSTFVANPAEVELATFDSCPVIVKKYTSIFEDFHLAVRPLLGALGISTAMKPGIFVGTKMGRSRVKKRQSILFSIPMVRILETRHGFLLI